MLGNSPENQHIPWEMMVGSDDSCPFKIDDSSYWASCFFIPEWFMSFSFRKDSNWSFLGFLLLGTFASHFFWGGLGISRVVCGFSTSRVTCHDFRWRMSTSWQAKLRAVRVAPLSSAHGPRTPGGSVGPPSWHRFDKVTTKKHQGCRVRYNVLMVQKSGVYIQLRER